MIGWNATLRSLAVVTAGAVVTYCGLNVLLTCHHRNDARIARKAPPTVHGCQKAKRARAKTSPLNVDVAQFGMPDFTPNGELEFTVTDKIPLVAGTSFGWRLHLDDASRKASNNGGWDKHSITMKEVFVLPSAPTTWGIGPSTALSDDLTTATTRRGVSLDATGGWISSAWSISAGDPAGHYKMMVFLDDQLVKTFEFDVEAPAKADVVKSKKQRKVNKKVKRTKKTKRIKKVFKKKKGPKLASEDAHLWTY